MHINDKMKQLNQNTNSNQHAPNTGQILPFEWSLWQKAKNTSFSNLDKTNNISHLIQPVKNYMYNPYQREWRSRWKPLCYRIGYSRPRHICLPLGRTFWNNCFFCPLRSEEKNYLSPQLSPSFITIYGVIIIAQMNVCTVGKQNSSGKTSTICSMTSPSWWLDSVDKQGWWES